MNIYTNPSSGIIEFNTGAASGDYIDLNVSGASRFTFENSGELNLTSYATEVPEKFTIDSQSGRLFSVDTDFDSVFSANDIAGLPVLEAYSDGTVVMGDYNSGDFVLTGNQVGIGTSTPSTTLDVRGTISGLSGLFGGTIKTQVYAIGSLPSASPAGQRAFVNDSYYAYTYAIIGNTAYAGGSYPAPVYSDGTYWKYG